MKVKLLIEELKTLKSKKEITKLIKELKLLDSNLNVLLSIDIETTIKQLKAYVQKFVEYFTLRWKGNPNFFKVKVYYNNSIIGISFKVIQTKPDKVITFNKQKNNNIIFDIIKINKEKNMAIFYNTKDVRGFNKNSFYIIKPNKSKNWQPKIAHFDLYDFVGAMLNEENEKWKKKGMI